MLTPSPPSGISWIHGHSLHIEYGRFDLHYYGFHCQLSKSSNARFDDWVHFAIPSPFVLDPANVIINIGEVRLNFKTQNAIVNTIHIWDGNNMLTHLDNLNMTGENSSATFAVPSTQVKSGIGVSVNVIHDANGSQNVSSVVEFRSAGAKFTVIIP